MGAIGVVLLWGGIAAVIVGFVVYAKKAEEKRRQAVEQFAKDLGLVYLLQLDAADDGIFQQFNLSRRGRGQRSSNVIVADSGELRMVIFEFQYTTGSGKNQNTHRQNVVLAASEALTLPDFSISPERFFHRIAEFFGKNDIDFDDDPEFSKHFLLHGPDESAVRAYFNKSRRQALLQYAQVHIEGSGHNFLFYYPSRRSKPEELKQLIEEAFSILTLLQA